MSEVAYQEPSPSTGPSTQLNPTVGKDSGKEVDPEEGHKITGVAANVGDWTSNSRGEPTEQLAKVNK